jgi:tetratricopeptide (TPR) repeat protein
MKQTLSKPKWSEHCLCGSGRKYKDCCWQRLLGFDIGKDYTKAIKTLNYERALIAARADIIQYTVWHKTNTEPMLIYGKPIPGLLKIDVDALADYVDRLLWLYVRLDRASELSAVLASLRNNIQHPTWRRKIAYFTALSNLGPGGDRKKAREEFAKVGTVALDEDDIELLQLYLDLEIDDEPFSTRIKYIDRILSLSAALSNQIQYRGAKAIQYFMIGDRSAAVSELTETINLVTSSEASDPLSHFERLLHARLMALLSSLTGDTALRKAAIGHFHSLLLQDDVTGAGRASLLREIGDCYKYARDWPNAISAYRDALAADHNPLDQIHLAECLVQTNQVDVAVEQIDSVDRTSLGHHEFEDFVFAFASIAVWKAEEARLNEAKGMLERLKTAEPYFNDRRLSLLVSVADTLATGNASEKAKADSAPDENPLSVASNIFIMKPTFMGMGIRRVSA